MSSQAQSSTPPREDADVHSASDEYAARFSGKAGRWMLGIQLNIVRRILRDMGSAATILDVGGGHGQLALPLLADGRAVTVIGSSKDALTQLRKVSNSAKLDTGDLLALPYADKSFDVVLCFRLLSHSVHWQALTAELCRVARTAVIVDYPTGESINSLTPFLFSAKKGVEKNTREYTLFSNSEIAAEFERNGFKVARAEKQFFWPMVLHRMLKTPAISSMLEFFPRLLGLTKRYGSPVIVEAVRKERA